jgi:Family of unknown function (DUF5996)
MSHRWPELHLADWRETRDVLHMWTQIVGKVRLALAPRLNHWWNVPLYVTARGLTTSTMPCDGAQVEIEFDFLRHQLLITSSTDQVRSFELGEFSVAEFYHRVFEALQSLGVDVKIWTMPVEVLNPMPFTNDTRAAYDREYAQRFWRVVASSADVLQEFRCGFVGKCSPVHFFWGSFDLAVTRFNGRRATLSPDVDPITREAYSHEVSSVGWWPGGTGYTGVTVDDAAYYAYMAPTPDGYGTAKVRPDQAFWHQQLGEFLLMYDEVRRAADPEHLLLEFLQSTYEAGARLGNWNRAELENGYREGEERGAELLAS